MTPQSAAQLLNGGETPTGDGEPSAAEILAQIDLMMSHAEFDASARNRRFLAYIVAETLAGRAARIKAYTIALAVFDRGDDFDPLTDPIVRIEASRLRRAIEHYYLTIGKNDRVRVDVPKGSYVPTFSYAAHSLFDNPAAAPEAPVRIEPAVSPAHPPPSAPAKFRNWFMLGIAACLLLTISAAVYVSGDYRQAESNGGFSKHQNPSIMVLPFRSIDDDTRNDYVATGMTYEIISQLTRFEEFFVFGPAYPSEDSSGGPAPEVRTPDYVLTGTVQTHRDSIHFNIVLTEQATGQSIWAWGREESLTASGIMEITQSVSQRVVNMLAQPDGVIFEMFRKDIAGKAARDLSSYECIISFRTYWRSYDRSNFDDTLACLERAIAAEPDYGPAYSALALMNIDRHRFGFGGGDPNGEALARAADLARQAVALEPRASQPYLALSLSLWFQHQIAESLAAAEQGLSFNPNNAELMADLGLRYALRGDWSKAMDLVDSAYERDPSAPTGYRVAHFLHVYMQGDFQDALIEADRIRAVSTTYGHIARAAALGQLGRSSEAAAAVADILRIDPDYAGKARADLAKRNMAPEIIDAIIDGLRKAGMAV